MSLQRFKGHPRECRGRKSKKNCEKVKREETSSDSSHLKKNRYHGQRNDIQRVTGKQSGTTVPRSRDKAKIIMGSRRQGPSDLHWSRK